jgi:hypothetical protein
MPEYDKTAIGLPNRGANRKFDDRNLLDESRIVIPRRRSY